MDVISKTIVYVKQQLATAEGGHDWFHIERVYKNAIHIATTEDCDLEIVKLAALLHDIADSKFYNGNEEIGPKMAFNFLNSLEMDIDKINRVVSIIKNISFKGGNHQSTDESIEFKIVQDADRLDAIGAIGIARTFNYGGFKNRKLYDPNIAPNLNMSKEEYKNSDAPTINHFYEKLLLLKELMHTKKAQELANQRHDFMVQFLAQFYAEWEGIN